VKRAKQRPKRRRRSITPEWQRWIAENLMLGATAESVTERLVAEGATAESARKAIATVRRMPAFSPGAEMARSSRRLLSVLQMLRELRVSTGNLEKIERRAKPPAREFFGRYVATSTPVVFTDATKGWKATRYWSPEYFRKKLGSVDIEVTTDREADPDYDMNTAAHSRVVKLGDFVDRITRVRRKTNDFYMVANNHAMNRAGMGVLLNDVVFDPEYFDPARARGSVSLWLGPAGTVTPMHHDTTNIVFHQIYGRKRMLLASPFETSLLRRARGVYCDVDPEHPERHRELADARILPVDLGPGDALYIPVGWWHHVRALDPSISISFTNLRIPNDYEWYRPGAIT
jgi:hypothetical protein